MTTEVHGRICVVTGANSGIGLSAARQLAERGATVLMVCRNPERGGEAQAHIAEATGNRPELLIADLAELEQVRRVAGELAAHAGRIDVLVNNAGVYMPERRTTSAGHEVTFAVNHLAAFALTQHLLPALERGTSPRVITLSSVAHLKGTAAFDDHAWERRAFDGMQAYCDSKLMNVLFTRELARRVASRGIAAHAVHPGVVRTGFAQDEPGFLNWLIRVARPLPIFIDADRGADTAVFLAGSPEGAEQSGGYWVRRRQRRPGRLARDEALARELWALSEREAGL